MEATTATLDHVRAYYGDVLRHTDDLKTTACCTDAAPPAHIRALLQNIDDEIQNRFYGCGSPLPPALEGCTVLDLGCGTGRDAYLAAQLAGPEGRVVGVDMTEAQLAVARRHEAGHARRFGFEAPTTDFRRGYVEDLAAAGLADASVDVVISNCVLNLSPDKPAAFREIFRVLKPGGELYFSDVFADRRLPEAVRTDPVLYGECLGGALYEEDFRRLLHALGCPDVRFTARSPIEVTDPELAGKLGAARFFSLTVRAFKLPGVLEDRCEDYGQVAYYRGTLPHAPHRFMLDDHHVFEAGRPMLVCGNTAAMVSKTRYAPHFRVEGDCSTHYGLFDCAPAGAAAETGGGACC